jgi:hypothetical protein
MHSLFHACEVEKAREPPIEWQETLDTENPPSLVQELRELVVLTLQPLGVKLIAQATFECGHSLGGMDQGFLVAGGVA